jgi:hypothetical protein
MWRINTLMSNFLEFYQRVMNTSRVIDPAKALVKLFFAFSTVVAKEVPFQTVLLAALKSRTV